MKETTKRIEAYKAALPGLRERLAAVALLLVVSMIMMISSTFAWVTLSRSPELNGLSTSISGNGNLEVALSKSDGSAPDEFDIDESVARVVDVTQSNLQWGNLINLSNSSYGLQNMVLRPAQLNTTGLLTNPLWGAQYGADGRIETLNTNFAFARYDGNQFIVDQEYGVRAIASYTATVADATQLKIDALNQNVLEAHNRTSQSYSEVRSKFDALGSMVSVYAQDIVNNMGESEKKYSDLGGYLGDMLPLYETLYNAMLTQQDSFVALRNLQLYIEANNAGKVQQYEPVTWEDISKNVSQHDGAGKLTSLKEYIKDLEALKADLEHLQKYHQDRQANGTRYEWYTGGDNGYQIYQMIERLIQFSTMTADLGSGEVVLASLSSNDIGKLISALGGGDKDVYLYGGIMYRFEQSSVNPDYRLNGQASCTIKIKYGISVTVKGRAQTKASGACIFQNDWSDTQGAKVIPSDAVAEDIYGMAVDFWVRTNAEETWLVLEGATTQDENGQTISYDAVNRIWGYTNQDGTAFPTPDSTSQGSGSCYIFYADTPEDQSRSLSLLEAMKVAFVSADGQLLAVAEMDTAHRVEVAGKVTVPMVLDSQNSQIFPEKDETQEDETQKDGTQEDGTQSEVYYAITKLTYDSAQRITAIIYLDGTSLSNDDVLAASEIQGQMNIQFGSSEDLQTVGDNDLLNAERKVSAELDTREEDKYNCLFSYEDRVSIPLNVKVLVDIEGEEAVAVKGSFVRQITATQGSREPEMEFQKLSGDQWSVEYTFTSPGTYVLREVQVNGINYSLEMPITVTITGFDLQSISWTAGGDNVTIRTSDGSYSTRVTAEFASRDTNKMPIAVQARFERESDGNTVNVPLAYNGGAEWTGMANFSTSGKYILKYLVYTVRDEGVEKNIYYGLDETRQKTLDLSLGLYAVVKNATGQENVEYESGKTYAWDVSVDIFDNAGNRLVDMENVKLVYANNGSVTNAVTVELTPDHDQYTGKLAIVNPGRWIFSYVLLGDQYLTRATESPTFTIISPDPVRFDTGSQGSYYGKTQYKPLTNDAIMDGIHIENSDAATIKAIVYNAAKGQYYTVDVGNHANDKASISLPKYATGEKNENGEDIYSQEGTWELVALMLSNCYAEDGKIHTEEDPVVWASANHRSYLESLEGDAALDVTDYLDFSRMTTKVSSTLNVTMEPGTTALGGVDYKFMHEFALKDIGMQVVLTDAEGNQIPASEVAADIRLNVQYDGSKASSYGYAVNGYGYSGNILLNSTHAESGAYTVSDGQSVWQYVGEYKVQSLTVTIGGQTVTLSPGQNGVPEKYTITTQTYAVTDIQVTNTNQVVTEFGKTGGVVSGTFLQSYDLSGTNMKLTLGKTDVNGYQFVKLEESDVTAELVLTHKGGSDANGGYTFTDSEYQNLTLSMTNTNGVYRPGSTVLLAGKYGVQIRYTIAGTVQTKTLSDISVYSKKPSLKITGVSPDTSKTVQLNTYTGSNAYLYSTAELTNVQNYYSDYVANVYIAASKIEDSKSGWVLVDYTLPTVKMTLSDGGSFDSASAYLNGNGQNFEFTSSNATAIAEIGVITKKTVSYGSGFGAGSTEYEIATAIGEQTISQIAVTKGNGVYSINLDQEIIIRQRNTTPPSITFVTPDGYDDFTSQVSKDGESFQITLPESIGATTHDYQKADDSVQWVKNEELSTVENLMYYKAGEVITEDVNWLVTKHWQSTVEFTYYCYTRTTIVEEKTTAFQQYRGTYDVVKWKIGDQEYEPGETITVTGDMHAEAVVGLIDEGNAVGDLITKTMRRFTRTESKPVVVNETGVAEVNYTTVFGNNKAEKKIEAEAAALAKYDSLKPDGYTWFDANDPTQYVEWGLPSYEELEVKNG